MARRLDRSISRRSTPPTDWARRVKGISTQIKYQAQKPGADAPDAQLHVPVFAGRRMFIRGGKLLYCVGEHF